MRWVRWIPCSRFAAAQRASGMWRSRRLATWRAGAPTMLPASGRPTQRARHRPVRSRLVLLLNSSTWCTREACAAEGCGPAQDYDRRLAARMPAAAGSGAGAGAGSGAEGAGALPQGLKIEDASVLAEPGKRSGQIVVVRENGAGVAYSWDAARWAAATHALLGCGVREKRCGRGLQLGRRQVGSRSPCPVTLWVACAQPTARQRARGLLWSMPRLFVSIHTLSPALGAWPGGHVWPLRCNCQWIAFSERVQGPGMLGVSLQGRITTLHLDHERSLTCPRLRLCAVPGSLLRAGAGA